MSLYIFVTEECGDDIINHGVNQDVEQFKKRIYETQRVGSLFDRFPPPYLKKRFKRQLRLIALEKKVKNDTIVCFTRLLVRSSREYIDFIHNPKEYGDRYFLELIDDKTLIEWHTELIKDPPPIKKRELSEDEASFLWGLKSNKDMFADSYFIYESFEWVEAVGTTEISNRLFKVADAISQFIDSGDDWLTKDIGGFIVCGLKIPHLKICYLMTICRDQEVAINMQKFDFDGLNDEDELNNHVIRMSRKSYPALLLADVDFWISIQKNQEFNLALSPEESDLLKSAVNSDNESEGFPLFINGRAGSGKSTILQYLYTDFFRFFQLQGFADFNPPIYLTYSDSLADRCITIVYGLLTKNFKATDSIIDFQVGTLKDNVRAFIPFLISIVPDNDKFRFTERNYIDYAKFKKLYFDHFSADPKSLRKYGIDISWHIIRSYIKGLSVDGYLELDEYEELPKNERNVTSETFKIVYEKVWSAWYKELTEHQDNSNNYWDSQDLVRYLLDNELIEPIYPAIFCDESQDFTRIELELLLRLCLYSDRLMDSNCMKQVPFAFAGDPFQTLNPTGFRWESIKSNYVEKFIQSLSPELIFGNPDLNYKELNYNYRSSNSIVKLCNSIQLLRLHLFDYTNINPQISWQSKDLAPTPVYFMKDDRILNDFFEENSSICFIIPCSEGEEAEFVKNDELLRAKINLDESGVPQNVFSPMRAKGLEFQRVVIYCFGHYSPLSDSIKELIKKKSELTKDQLIPIEYFINQLYVAASRAQKRLFVIDDEHGLNRLWSICTDSTLQEELLQVRESKKWESEIGILVKGNSNSWSEDKEDPIHQAVDFESLGELNRDPYFLHQASMLYKHIGDLNKSIECKAKAYSLEEKFQKSGNSFFEVKLFTQALKAYWRGRHFKDIMRFTESTENHGLINRFEVRISHLIFNPMGSASLIPLLKDFVDLLDQIQFRSELKEEQEAWSLGVQNLLDKNTSKTFTFSNDDYITAYNYIVKINEILSINLITMGNFAYMANDYEAAIKYFEKGGDTKTQNYIDSKRQKLYKDYNSGSSLSLDKEERKLLCDHLIQLNRMADAVGLFKVTNDYNSIKQLLSKSYKDEEQVNVLLKAYIEILDETGEWSSLIATVRNQSREDRVFAKNLEILSNEVLSYSILVMAKSTTLVNADNKIKEIVSDFLKEKFLKESIFDWKDKFSPEIIGSAFERAGRDIDCLKFYEKIVKVKSFSDETKRRAEIRWTKVKEKQTQREERAGIKDIAAKHGKELSDKIRELNISITEIPDFPSIEDFIIVAQPTITVKTTSSTPKVSVETIANIPESGDIIREKYTCNIDDKKITVNLKTKRINIEDIELSKIVGIYANDQICKSTDYEIIEIDHEYVIKELNIRIKFTDDKVNILFSNLNLECQMDI